MSILFANSICCKCNDSVPQNKGSFGPNGFVCNKCFEELQKFIEAQIKDWFTVSNKGDVQK